MKKIGIKIASFFVLILLIILVNVPSNNKEIEEIHEDIVYPTNCPPLKIIIDSFANQISWGKEYFNFLTGVPEEYEAVFYIACSYFPELSKVPIEINYAPIPTTMQTQPIIGSIFGKQSDRKYRISINSKADFEGIFFADIPLNAQVGIVAHELAHVLDFENKNTLQILGTGVKFFSKKSQARFEKSIDLLTIYKGLGWQLRDWAQYAMFESKASEEYKKFKKNIYLSPSEIEAIIRKNPTICDVANDL